MNPLLLTSSSQDTVRRLDLNPSAAKVARQLFDDAAREFRRGEELLIDFEPGCHLQEGECFQISDFVLDESILRACRQPIGVNRVDAKEIPGLGIVSIIGYHENDEKEIYFQNFDSRRIIVPGKRGAVWATADSSTFEELPGPVLLLDAALAAIWRDGTLFFKSFHQARKIFDLSNYFKVATDEQVVQFASNTLFAPGDSKAVLQSCSEWHRKKIALILSSEGFKLLSPDDLLAAASSCEYELPMKGDQIELPTDRKALRLLLQFLDEDIYRGPFSQNQFVSSGKRVGKSPKKA